jgi:hypothetical protein
LGTKEVIKMTPKDAVEVSLYIWSWKPRLKHKFTDSAAVDNGNPNLKDMGMLICIIA